MVETAAEILLVFLALGFVLSALLVYFRVSSLNRAYALAAEKLGLRAETRLSSFPSIAFRDALLEGTISGRFGGAYSPGATRLSARPAVRNPLWMHAFKRTAIGTIHGLFAGGGIETRDRAFDAAFLVRGSDRDACLGLLDLDVRAALADLDSAAGAGLRLSVCPGSIVIETHAIMDHAAEIEAFARKAMHVAAGIAAGLANLGAVEFVPAGTVETPNAPKCQVCGGEVSGPAIECRKCGTIAHRECWDFAGECPAYGCRSRKRRKRDI